jgi:hypothetical protein
MLLKIDGENCQSYNVTDTIYRGRRKLYETDFSLTKKAKQPIKRNLALYIKKSALRLPRWVLRRFLFIDKKFDSFLKFSPLIRTRTCEFVSTFIVKSVRAVSNQGFTGAGNR